MPFPLTEWWFWAFLAPPAAFAVAYLALAVVAALGRGAAYVAQVLTGERRRPEG